MFLAVSVLLIDQIAKYWVLHNLAFHQALVLVPGLIGIEHQHNTGMAFSILASQPLLMQFLVTAIIAGLTLFVSRIPADKKLLHWAFALILGGAYSNLLDRYVHGFVVDYINFLFVDFAVFNLADVALNLGAVLLIADLLKPEATAESCKYKESANAN